MCSNAHEMMHRTQRADTGPVFDGDVSTESCGVGHDDVAADLAIVCDVSVGHDQVVIADLGEAPALYGAAIDGDELTNLVVVADFQAGRLAGVGQILWRQADRREGEEAVICADLCRPFHAHLRHHSPTLSHFHLPPNY